MRTRYLFCVLWLGLAAPALGADPVPAPAEPTALRQLREFQERQQKLQQQLAPESHEAPVPHPAGEQEPPGRFSIEHSAPVTPRQEPNPGPLPGQGEVAPPTDTGTVANQMQQRLDQVRRQQQQGAVAGGNEDAEINELEAAQKKMMDQVGALNAVNPMSADSSSGGTGAFGARRSQGGSDDQLGALQGKMGEWMAKPWFRQFAETMQKRTSDPEVMKAITELSKNKNMRWMYAGIFIWTLVCWFLKRRVLAATDRLLPRLMLRSGMYCVYLVGYFLVSYSILGPPLVKLLGAMLPAVGSAVLAVFSGPAK